jgi:hypothetical protein
MVEDAKVMEAVEEASGGRKASTVKASPINIDDLLA